MQQWAHFGAADVGRTADDHLGTHRPYCPGSAGAASVMIAATGRASLSCWLPSAGELHRLQPRVDGPGKTTDQVNMHAGSHHLRQIAGSGLGMLSSLFESADHGADTTGPLVDL